MITSDEILILISHLNLPECMRIVIQITYHIRFNNRATSAELRTQWFSTWGPGTPGVFEGVPGHLQKNGE